jgi:hypothetical protein
MWLVVFVMPLAVLAMSLAVPAMYALVLTLMLKVLQLQLVVLAVSPVFVAIWIAEQRKLRSWNDLLIDTLIDSWVGMKLYQLLP